MGFVIISEKHSERSLPHLIYYSLQGWAEICSQSPVCCARAGNCESLGKELVHEMNMEKEIIYCSAFASK